MANGKTPDWLEELLEAEEAKEKTQIVEMNKIKADQALAAIAVIEDQINEINSIAEQEIKLVQEWNMSQIEKLNKKISWLSFNLEMFIKKLDLSTIQLAHGEIKLRKGKDKFEVVDMDKFLPLGKRLGLVRTIAAKVEPDLIAIANHVKLNGGKPPSGVMLTPGQTKFSYKTTKGSNNNVNDERNETETGSPAGPKSSTQIAA